MQQLCYIGYLDKIGICYGSIVFSGKVEKKKGVKNQKSYVHFGFFP